MSGSVGISASPILCSDKTDRQLTSSELVCWCTSSFMQHLGECACMGCSWVAYECPSTLLPCWTRVCITWTTYMHATATKATPTYCCHKCRMLRCNDSIPTSMLNGPFRVQDSHSILHAHMVSGGLAHTTQASLHWQCHMSTQCTAVTQPSKLTWQAWTPPGSKVCRQPQAVSPVFLSHVVIMP